MRYLSAIEIYFHQGIANEIVAVLIFIKFCILLEAIKKYETVFSSCYDLKLSDGTRILFQCGGKGYQITSPKTSVDLLQVGPFQGFSPLHCTLPGPTTAAAEGGELRCRPRSCVTRSPLVLRATSTAGIWRLPSAGEFSGLGQT